MVKFTKTKSRTVFARARIRGSEELCLRGIGFQFCKMKKLYRSVAQKQRDYT